MVIRMPHVTLQWNEPTETSHAGLRAERGNTDQFYETIMSVKETSTRVNY